MPLLDSEFRIVRLRIESAPAMRLPPWPVLAVLSPFVCGCWLMIGWAARAAWLWMFR